MKNHVNSFGRWLNESDETPILDTIPGEDNLADETRAVIDIFKGLSSAWKNRFIPKGEIFRLCAHYLLTGENAKRIRKVTSKSNPNLSEEDIAVIKEFNSLISLS